MTAVVATGPKEHDAFLFQPPKEDGVEYIFGVVTKLERDACVLADGTRVAYDVCVVTTGLSYPVFRPTVSVFFGFVLACLCVTFYGNSLMRTPLTREKPSLRSTARK
jgi:hypothetical protein